MTAHVIVLPDASLDLRCAAERADVEFRDMVAAVARNELSAREGAPGRPGVWLVRAGDVDRWSRRRLATP